MAVVLALDIGGTKLAAAVVDDAGRMLGRGRVPSPTGTDPEPLRLVTCRYLISRSFSRTA